MISKIYDHKNSNRNEETVKDTGLFLSDYAAQLLGCGATCARAEKNTQRISKAFNIDMEIAIMPSHIHLSVSNKEHTETFNIIKRIPKSAISFNINTLLSKLSWNIADGKVGFQAAKHSFNNIINSPPENQRLVLLLASLANASFCRLFGGDSISMLIVFIATLVGYRVKQIMLEDKMDIRLVFFCSAFFSSVIAACGHLFSLGETPEIALGTSVLYLIPGIPYINSISDMLDKHYICSFSRFMDAAILTACLSAGMCGGLLLMDLSWF